MDNFTFPQNAKTNHPEVIAAVEETLKLKQEFREKARVISEKYTGDKFKGWLAGRTFEGMSLSSIEVTEEQYASLPGQWKKRDHMGRTSPYSNNKKAEGFHIGYRSVGIPGRGNLLWGNGYMGTGTIFLHEGYVYSHLGFKPQISEHAESMISKFAWTEILASELHLALEAYNDARKEK